MKRSNVLLFIMTLFFVFSCDQLLNTEGENDGTNLSGVTGTVYEELGEDVAGNAVSDCIITFTSVDETYIDQVVCDETGKYHILLPGGDYLVKAVNYNYDIFYGELTVEEMSIVENDIHLPRLSSKYSGSVVELLSDESYGDNIEGVRLTFTSAIGDRVKEIITNSNGEYSILLHPGNYNVRAFHEGFKIYDSPGNGYFSVDNQGDHTETIYLSELISGKRGVCREELEYATYGDPIEGVILIFTSEDYSFEQEVVSDVNGQFEILLQEGRYRVRTVHPDFDTVDYEISGGFTVVDEDTMHSSNYFLKALAGGFQGHIEQNNYPSPNAPIDGAIIIFTSDDGRLSKTTTSDGDGYYTIKLPHARYRLSVQHSDYQTYDSGKVRFSLNTSGYDFLDRYLIPD